MGESLTPVQRGKRKLKITKLPRGRSFEKGNSIGVTTRFQPGQRANPDGRPRSAKLSEAYRALLALPVDADVDIRTNAEDMAYRVFRMGKKGNLGACMEIGNRSEGRPAVTVNFDSGPDNLTLIVQRMNQNGAALGKPEGFIPRQLSEGDDEQEAE